MNCMKCGQVIEIKSKFCWNCGEKIIHSNEVAATAEISTGEGSINLAVGSGNKVEIGNFITSMNTKVSNNIIQYKYEEYGKPLNTKRFKYMKNSFISLGSAGTILGIISSVLSIMKDGFQIQDARFFNTIIPFSSCILFAGFLLHIMYKDLNTQGFMWLRFNNFFSMRFLKGSDSKIYKIKIEGNCPKCGGRVSLHKQKEGNKIVGYCEKNYEHKYDFDHTSFTGKDING